jgi:hypothetical protein
MPELGMLDQIVDFWIAGLVYWWTVEIDQILECLVTEMKASQKGLKATTNANQEEEEANLEWVRAEMKAG